MSQMIATQRKWRIGIAAAVSFTLAGCISLGGGEPPESLLNLTAVASAPATSTAFPENGESKPVLAVMTPDAPAKLNVLRVPVAVSGTEIAYLKDAVWVEKPARLFRRLVGETLRASADNVLVLDGEETAVSPTQYLRGTLLDMTYDASASEVVVRYDAIFTDGSGEVRSRRFEAREEVALPEVREIGPALNRAANAVAAEVAEWVNSAG